MVELLFNPTWMPFRLAALLALSNQKITTILFSAVSISTIRSNHSRFRLDSESSMIIKPSNAIHIPFSRYRRHHRTNSDDSSNEAQEMK